LFRCVLRAIGNPSHYVTDRHARNESLESPGSVVKIQHHGQQIKPMSRAKPRSPCRWYESRFPGDEPSTADGGKNRMFSVTDFWAAPRWRGRFNDGRFDAQG
jgi:hypothetical protein